MMKNDQLVSVIIPTYYRNDQLRTALKHVYQQTYEPIEVIVVDDSGEHHAKPIIDEFDSVRYIGFNENKGPNMARTAGIQASKGEFIQLLDDDDQPFPTKLEKQIAVFQENPDLAVVYSGGVYEDRGPFIPYEDARGNVLQRALIFDLPACITSSMLIRREPLSDVLPLPDPPGSDDTYLKIELAQQGKFDFIPEPLLLKREGQDARSHSAGAVEGTRGVLSIYSDLYDQFSPAVRQTAIAAAEYRNGKYQLRESVWSLDAVRSIWSACRAYPGLKVKYWLMFFVSLFGHVGFAAQREAKATIRTLLQR